MIEQERIPRRFGAHASVIQFLAWFIYGSVPDGGITSKAVMLASLLFWTCAASLLWWHDGRASRVDLFFLRWGLLAFVLIGTPQLRPVVQSWAWLELVLIPPTAVLIVMPLLYLVVRGFGLSSFFDELGPGSPCDDKPPPEV
jgi:hypothetical protein